MATGYSKITELNFAHVMYTISMLRCTGPFVRIIKHSHHGIRLCIALLGVSVSDSAD